VHGKVLPTLFWCYRVTVVHYRVTAFMLESNGCGVVCVSLQFSEVCFDQALHTYSRLSHTVSRVKHMCSPVK
jgi:hypothetical protein